MSLKDNGTHQSNNIANETPVPSLAELTLAYKELQKKKMLIQDLIHQNKTLKKKLQALKKSANQTKHDQQSLLANISHEIRTPLHAIVGLSNSLQDITDENERKESINIIENSAFVLGAVISNILDTAKIDSRNIKLDIHPFNLSALIRNLQTTFTYRLKGKPVEFKTKINEDIPDLVEGDEQKLLHVLFNLLNNAEKFTEQGTIQLSVAIVKSLHDKIWTAFTIEDTGMGLGGDDPHVSNERFKDYKEKREDLNKKKLGLGLPIASTLIKLLKGDIRIESDTGTNLTEAHATLESDGNKGVKITMVLPFNQHRGKNDKKKILAVEDNTPLPALNILIAEDNSINRKYYSILFSKWDIPHTFVNNGKEAIEKINM